MSMIELLVVTCVVALLSPLMYWLFIYGVQSFGTHTRHIDQQYKVLDVTQRIRMDIEEAAGFKVNYDPEVGVSELVLKFPDYSGTNYEKIWRLEDGKLFLKSNQPGEEFTPVLEGLDTSVVYDSNTRYMLTRFEYSGNEGKILLSIKPVETNTTVNKNRNVTNPIITEFSVKYKEVIQ